MAVTSNDVLNWLNSHPGATDKEIASYMVNNGVTSALMANITGIDKDIISKRFSEATTQAQKTQNIKNELLAQSGLITAKDPNLAAQMYSGGAYGTDKQGLGSQEAVFSRFAEDLASQGVSSIYDLKEEQQLNTTSSGQAEWLGQAPVYDTVYRDSATGKIIPNGLPTLYDGEGATKLNLTYGEDGTPVFSTSGYDTSTFAGMEPLLGVGAMFLAGPLATALGGGTAGSAAAGAILGGGTAAITGNDILKGALAGGLMGGITGALNDGLATTGDYTSPYAEGSVRGALSDMTGSGGYDWSGFNQGAAEILASSTSDPIAAMNAIKGWTGVDTSYLNNIGLTPEMIANVSGETVQQVYDRLGLESVNPYEVGGGLDNVINNSPDYTGATSSSLTDAEKSALLKAGVSLAGTALAPNLPGLGSYTPGGAFVPSNSMPVPNQAYYDQLQAAYDKFGLAPRDVVSPLQDWYSGMFSTTPASTAATTTPAAVTKTLPPIDMPTNLGQTYDSAQANADYYNQLADQGYTDAQIRQAAEATYGPIQNVDWNNLTNIASGVVPASSFTTQQATPITPSMLTSSSTPQDIAAAYQTYLNTVSQGDETPETQAAAYNYLNDLGLSYDQIANAYSTFKGQ